MWSRLLLAIDQYESGQTALAFTAGLAIATDSNVRVLHLRELALGPRVPPLETPNDAQLLVDGATLSLRLAGVGAEGQARSVRATASRTASSRSRSSGGATRSSSARAGCAASTAFRDEGCASTCSASPPCR